MMVDKPDPVEAGGTTSTGNIACNLLFDPVQRKVLVECIREKTRRDGRCDRDVFGEFVTNLSVILKAVSSRKNVNIEELDKLCKETSLLIHVVTHWPTFKFTPSMRQILVHSAALIDANGSTGLSEYSEEPLEHNNKNIRKYRESLARKTTQSANLSDVLIRLWIKSDPIIRYHCRVVKCSFCGEEHNVRSCPKKQAEPSSCLSFEDNLLASIFLN